MLAVKPTGNVCDLFRATLRHAGSQACGVQGRMAPSRSHPSGDLRPHRVCEHEEEVAVVAHALRLEELQGAAAVARQEGLCLRRHLLQRGPALGPCRLQDLHRHSGAQLRLRPPSVH